MFVRQLLGSFTQVRRSLVVTAVTVAIAGLVPVLSATSAQAAGTGSGVSYTLEGCRASSAVYPALGPFICPDASYTTGNLGGGWNELDLVPGRVIVSAGNSAPATQDISFDVAVDTCSTTGSPPCTGTPGYDKLSTLTLNTGPGESSGTCGTPTIGAAAVSGTSLFRQVDISGIAQNATCVYDFYARLALGSHNFPGSSLHYNLTNTSHGSQGIGSKDISIPVRQIAPFVFSKTETASQGSSVVWTVNKSATSSVSFSDTCLSTTAQTDTVQVTWGSTVTNGAITVDGKITIGNNAHRPLGILVSDQLYDGTNQSSPDGSPKVHDQSGSPYFPALTTSSYDDIWSPPANVATSYNDIATGTINDPVFGDSFSLPNATASASVVTSPPNSGATAVITDVEALTDGSSSSSVTPATDYKFRVTAVSPTNNGTIYSTYLGAGNPGNVVYTPGASATLTTGPLTWVSTSQSGSGSVTFTKSIVPNQATTETATLHDTATISPAGQSSTTASASTAISAGATVAIGVAKQISVALAQDITFNFYAYAPGHGPVSSGGDGVSAGSASVTIPAGTTGPVTTNPRITGLDPGVQYLIDEPAVAPFPPFSFSKTVSLPTCSSDQAVTNTAAPTTAQVQKITTPGGSTNWTMTLTGVEADGTTPVSDLGGTPGGTSEVLSSGNLDPVVANAGYFPFQSVLDQDGATYTITETTQTNWDNTTITGDIGAGNNATTSTSTHTCSIVLDLTTESGNTFECTFTNVERSDVKVVKTQDGATPTLQFSFRLCPGTSLSACGGASPPSGSTTLKTNNGEIPVGTLDFGYQVPGSYVLCELAVPAGWHSTLQDSPYNGTLDGATGNVCLTFTLGAGSDTTFTVDNSSPKGNALTIGYWKHWNSVNVGSSSGAGNKLMDTYLVAPYPPLYLGPFLVGSAQTGVNVLSAPSMKYAENGLAAQLLAAILNVRSGALTCPAITNAISHAQSLLNGISYAGPVGSTVGNKYPTRSDWVATASTLDSYNNNTLC